MLKVTQIDNGNHKHSDEIFDEPDIQFASHMIMSEKCIDWFRQFLFCDNEQTKSQLFNIVYTKLKKQLFHIIQERHSAIICLMDSSFSDWFPEESDPEFLIIMGRIAGEIGVDLSTCLAQLAEMRDANPEYIMSGTRLAMIYPDIMRLQVHAIAGACLELKQLGIDATPRILLPAINSPNDLRACETVIHRAWTAYLSSKEILTNECTYTLGAMIQTPRACFQIEQIAKMSYLKFIVFDSDKLTALMYGMDSGEIAHEIVDVYSLKRVMTGDPFKETTDTGTVGKMVVAAVRTARLVNPGIQVSLWRKK